MQKIILSLVLFGFSILTGFALYYHGYWGIIEPHFKSFGAAQVFVDLVIALSIIMVWIWKDAKKSGKNPYFWLILTLLTGSIGPIVYLLTKPKVD